MRTMSGAVKIWGHATAEPTVILGNFEKHVKLERNEREASAWGRDPLGRLLG